MATASSLSYYHEIGYCRIPILVPDSSLTYQSKKKTRPIPRGEQGHVPLDLRQGWESAFFPLSALGLRSRIQQRSEGASCLNDVLATQCRDSHKQGHDLVWHLFTPTHTIKILLLARSNKETILFFFFL